MESKFKLQLGKINKVETVTSAVINGLSYEFFVDLVHTTLREYHKDTDLTKLIDEFNEIINFEFENTYSSIEEWSQMKMNNLARLSVLVCKVDDFLKENNKIKPNDVKEQVQTKMYNFLIDLNNKIHVDDEILDIGDLDVNQEFVEKVLRELSIVNQAQIMISLITSDLDISPIDVEPNKNIIVEKKLENINKIITKCTQLFNDDEKKLTDKLLVLYDKFYNLTYEYLTDGEKAEKARKIIKGINSHRQLLDKLEDKLVSATELSRQLKINAKNISENFEKQKEDGKQKIIEDPYKTDVVQYELDSAEYVTNSYISQIDSATKSLNVLKEKISERYDVLDKVETALKSAIPTEDEMKKYSTLSLKLQELSVRLELAKSQLNKDNKDLKIFISAAVTGLSTLIASTIEAKDVFMRNSLMTSIFKAVNAVYNFVNGKDKTTEILQIKFITDKIAEYNDEYQIFTKDLSEYRHVANNTIRDISIIMGKPFGLKGLREIIDTVDIGIKQFDNLLESIKSNNEKQNAILNAVLVL